MIKELVIGTGTGGITKIEIDELIELEDIGVDEG